MKWGKGAAKPPRPTNAEARYPVLLPIDRPQQKFAVKLPFELHAEAWLPGSLLFR